MTVEDLLSPADATPLFSDDFEGDVSQWTLSEGWQYRDEAGNHFFEARPGNRRFQDDLALSTPIDLTGSASPVLRYQSAHGLTRGASGRVQVSVDEGATWTDVQVLEDTTDLAWVEQTVDLSAFAGQTILLRFHYEWIDLATGGPFGNTLPSRVWRVDDVRIE
ncbi:MAG: hypothetical protein JXA10_03690 [Anaerolineae bacterium]|nr:hypothetical protein [Anaerolineae bacterium]